MGNDQHHTGHIVSAPASHASSISPNGPTTTNPSNRELFRTRASRLVSFFPNELVIQEKTVSVIRRDLMISSVETIPVRDIGRVVYINTPVFASIEILGKNTAHDLCIGGLNKVEALKAKEIIESLLLEDKDRSAMASWIHPEKRRETLGGVDEEFES